MRTRHLSPATADRFFAPAVITAPKLLALLAAIWWLALAHSALQAADVVVPRAIQSIVDSPDRSDADRETDQRRQPVKLLAFFGVKP